MSNVIICELCEEPYEEPCNGIECLKYERRLWRERKLKDGCGLDRRCQKCGEPTKSEEALVDGQIWCHPCADRAS